MNTEFYSRISIYVTDALFPPRPKSEASLTPASAVLFLRLFPEPSLTAPPTQTQALPSL